jgi:hypothetical protein
MSRGLSKTQTYILQLFRGEVAGQVYNVKGGLDTGEIVDELEECGLLNESTPRRQKLSTVRRACDLLQRRKLLQSKYGFQEHGYRAVAWSLASTGEAPQ